MYITQFQLINELVIFVCCTRGNLVHAQWTDHVQKWKSANAITHSIWYNY